MGGLDAEYRARAAYSRNFVIGGSAEEQPVGLDGQKNQWAGADHDGAGPHAIQAAAEMNGDWSGVDGAAVALEALLVNDSRKKKSKKQVVEHKKQQKKNNSPRHEIEALAPCLLPNIQEYFESEEEKQEFAKWKREQEENQKNKNKSQ